LRVEGDDQRLRPIEARRETLTRFVDGVDGAGRAWVAWMLRGVFIHRPITAAPQVRSEKAIGWIFHSPLGSSTQGFMLLSCGSGLARRRPSSQR